MQRLKSIFLFSITVLLIYAASFTSYILAAFIMNVIIWIAVFVWFDIYPQTRLPDRFYVVPDPEVHLYKLIALKKLKRIITHTPLKWLNQRIQLKGKNPSSLNNTIYFCKEAETAHIIDFVVISFLALGSVFFNWPKLALWLILFGLPMNVFPIMVLRYNRNNLERLL